MQVVNHIHQLFLAFYLWTSASPSLILVITSSTGSTTPGFTSRLAWSFSLAPILPALLELFFNLLSQKDALINSNWGIILLFIIRIAFVFVSRVISILILASFKYFSEMICEEVGHRFVLFTPSFIITIAEDLGWARLPHKVEEA